MKYDTSIEWKFVPANELDLSKHKVLVIGGTSGIGRQLSKDIASRGADVTVVGRTFKDQDIRNIKFLKADLTLMTEAKNVAKELPTDFTHVVLTCGILAAQVREETSEGIEKDMAVSFLNRLVILDEIVPKLSYKDGVKPRVFNMGYPGDGKSGEPQDLNSEKKYGALAAHFNTVAGNEALILDFKEKYPEVNFFGLNPGIIKTGIRSNLWGNHTWLSRVVEWMIGLTNQNVEQYSTKITPLLFTPEIEYKSGAMFDKNGEAILPSACMAGDYSRNYIDMAKKLLDSKVPGVLND